MPEFDSTIQYRSVPEYPNYIVGSNGSVWSKYVPGGGGKTGDWRSLKLTERKGYRVVNLCHNKKHRLTLVHHIVLWSFVGQCPTSLECCHFDGDPSNNHVENLRWGTKKSNGDDRVRHGTVSMGEHRPTAKLSDQSVIEIREMAANGTKQDDIAARFGVAQGVVSSIVRRVAWKHVRSPAPIPPNRNIKLTEEIVQEIRSLHAYGYSQKSLATTYRVSLSSVNMIVNRRSWQHVRS